MYNVLRNKGLPPTKSNLITKYTEPSGRDHKNIVACHLPQGSKIRWREDQGYLEYNCLLQVCVKLTVQIIFKEHSCLMICYKIRRPMVGRDNILLRACGDLPLPCPPANGGNLGQLTQLLSSMTRASKQAYNLHRHSLPICSFPFAAAKCRGDLFLSSIHPGSTPLSTKSCAVEKKQ